MFGKEILNGKQLCEKLGISTIILYQLIDNGMPYHQLTTNSKKYYIIDEIEQWLLQAGYHAHTVWVKD